MEANAFSVERTLSSTGGTKLRHIIFIIIESGMALFAIQLVRLVLLAVQSYNLLYVLPTGINQMSNVIIRSFNFYFFCFADKHLLG